MPAVLIALLLAVAEPMTEAQAAPAARTVLLIDRSASMSAAGEDGILVAVRSHRSSSLESAHWYAG